MNTSAVDFIQRLVRQFPILQPLYEEHLADYDELLPHVFMGDFTRWLISVYSGDQKLGNAESTIRAILDYVERAFVEGDEELKELIAVSFLENLPLPGEQHASILRFLGSELIREYLRIQGLA
ncbi:MAG: hypothetical protein IMX01_10635 [Limnochordaceae bacterium]|nr:hypothetical protein [Limnochordaceae bacterium]